MEMTFTELREQILANAMRLFPTVVEDYLTKHGVTQAKPEEVFDVVTVRPGESYGYLTNGRIKWAGYNCREGKQALITYGDQTSPKTALATEACDSWHEAFTDLLDATEHALGVQMEGGCLGKKTKLRAAIKEGGYRVDQKLLRRNGKRNKKTLLSGLTDGDDEA